MSAVEIASTGWGTLLRPTGPAGSLVPVVGATCQINILGGGSATIWSDNTRTASLTQPLTTRSDGTLAGFIDLGTYTGTWTIPGQAPFSHQLDMAGPTGATGPPGVGASWQGVWSSGTTYTLNQGVSRNGLPYISNANGNLNHDPATDAVNWAAINPVDGAIGTGTMRTLGPGQLQALAGNTLANGTVLADRDALYGSPPSLALTTNASSMTQAVAGDTTHQWAAGFFGLLSAAGSPAAANNVGLYGFADEKRTSPTGGTWGANFGATNRNATPGNVQGCEVDINNMGADSGTTASGAQNVGGVSIASGGTKRPLYALNVVQNGGGRFVYGARFAEDSIYSGGAVVQSLVKAANPTATQWETYLYDTSYVNPTFTFDAMGKLRWGPATGAVDTNLYRSAAATLKTDSSLIVNAGVFLCNFSAGQTLSFFGSAGASRQAAAAAATDLASVITLANSLRTGLQAYGQFS